MNHATMCRATFPWGMASVYFHPPPSSHPKGHYLVHHHRRTMCESVVFLSTKEGLTSVMTDAMAIRNDGSSFVCVNMVGKKMVLHDVILSEVDLMRHRVIFERQ